MNFTDAREEYEPSSDCSSGDETMSGESDTFEPVKDDLSEESDNFEHVQDDLSGERLFRQLRDKMLSGESDSRHFEGQSFVRGVEKHLRQLGI